MSEIMTFEEVCKYLKFSKSKLYNLVQQKKIPASKIGRNWRFKKSKIEAWFDKRENKNA